MSIKLGDALVYLGADKAGLKRDLDQAQQETKSWVSALGNNIAQGIGQGIGQGLTNLATQALGSVKRLASEGVRSLTQGMVGGNAQFEQYNAQFEVLLNSSADAKKRMADLAAFGRSTPFDLPGVVQADLVLQGFGLHAENVAQRFGFSGEEIRRIAGDVSSGTKASFEEMAGYLGKFSSGATGEAIARFQEMGIVTRAELAGLGLEFSKSGELLSPMDEAMTVLLNHMNEKYGGMMDVQSKTFNGMISNLGDWKGNALRIIGEPTFELLKEQLQGLLTFLDSPGVKNAVLGLRDLFYVATQGALAIMRGFGAAGKAFFTAIFGDFDTASSNMAANAGGWGRNVVLQFARGMAAAATAVVTVLNNIGKVITGWLAPGSPPRLLPDIDDWGTAAMQQFVDGMGRASVDGLKAMGSRIMDSLGGVKDAGLVDLFSNITGTITRLMQSTAGEDDKGLVGRIIGNRAIIGQAIQDIQQYGQVTAGTLSAIQQALVTLPPSAAEYVQAMIQLYQASQNVTQAQEELNRVTQEYDDKISPLRDELEALQNQEANISDEKRIAALKQALARGALNDEQKAQAQREIRSRELAMQIRGLEDEKETAVDAAQVKLDAAEKEQKAAEAAVALQQSLIDAQLESNDLIKQQISLLDRLADTMAAIGESIADALGGAGSGLSDLNIGGVINESLKSSDKVDIKSLFDNLDVNSMVLEIEREFIPLKRSAGELSTTFTDLGTAWTDFLTNLGLIDENGQPALDFLGTLADVLLIIGGALIGAKLAAGITGLATALGTVSTAAAGATGTMGTFSAIVTALGGPILWLMVILGALAAAWTTDFGGMRTTLTALDEHFELILSLLWEKLTQWAFDTWLTIGQWALNVMGEFGKVGTFFTILGATLWLKGQEIKTTFLLLQQKIKEEIEKIKGFFTDAKTAVTDMRTLFQEQIDKITEKFDAAKTKVSNFLDQLKGLWEWIKSHTFDISLPSLPGVPSEPPGGARAAGGPVNSGSAYLVGEEGPEVFVPQSSGNIIPNSGRGETGTAVGAPTTHVYFSGDIRLGDVGAVEAFISWLQGMSDSANLNREVLQFSGA